MDWLRERFQVSYVDLVTYPGVDGLLAGDAADAEHLIRSHVEVSVNGHHSPVVAIVGHAECLGNPASEEEHRAHVQRAVKRVLAWNLGVTVIGLWVTPRWAVDVVQTRAAA